MTFPWMQPVCLDIAQVVETIDGTRDEAKRHKHNQRGPKIVQLQQIVAEKDWHKDKHVLEPLQRAEELNIILHRRKITIFFEIIKDIWNIFVFLQRR
jgi:hypothetical protein